MARAWKCLGSIILSQLVIVITGNSIIMSFIISIIVILL